MEKEIQDDCLQSKSNINTQTKKTMELGTFNAASFAEIIIEIGAQTSMLRDEISLARYSKQKTEDDLKKQIEYSRKQDAFIKELGYEADRRVEKITSLEVIIHNLKKQMELPQKQVIDLQNRITKLRGIYKKLHAQKT
jgi:hypothetical protein